jgi:SAM-dependent methyltransferase
LVSGLDGHKRTIADAYDRSSGDFAKFADGLVYKWLAQPLIDALSKARGPILDVATGSGALGRALDDPVGVDLSLAQLSLNPLRRRVQADAERLPFANDTFAAAGCAFGINHFPDPAAAVSEMARVAECVGLLTWCRPQSPFPPKDRVQDAIETQCGSSRSVAGGLVDQMSDAVGSEGAVRALLDGAGLSSRVTTLEVEVPWPGADAFIDYRLAMISTPAIDDLDAIRRSAKDAILTLPHESLQWRPRLVLGLGRRMIP